MKDKVVLVVITARPSYCRVRTALAAIDEHPDLDLKVVVTSSGVLEEYGNLAEQIQSDGFPVTHTISTVFKGNHPATMAKTTGISLIELSTLFQNCDPSIVVTIADRHETLATATAAAYMNIPVAHIQGGEVTGSIDDKVRNAVTQLSDLHLVTSMSAAGRVIKMGARPDSVVVTGCPSLDVALQIQNKPKLNTSVISKYVIKGQPIENSKDYIVVLLHPDTTKYLMVKEELIAAYNSIQSLGVPAYWCLSNNNDAGTEGAHTTLMNLCERNDKTQTTLLRNMRPEDFLVLANNASVVVGNSSVGIRECSFLGIPVVNIGSRQSGRDRGPNVIDTDFSEFEIKSAITIQLNKQRYRSHFGYGDGSSGQRIADAIFRFLLRREDESNFSNEDEEYVLRATVKS